MGSKNFRFPNPQLIGLCLPRFKPDLVAFFISRAEDEVTRWGWNEIIQQQKVRASDKITNADWGRMAANFRRAGHSLLGGNSRSIIFINMINLYHTLPKGTSIASIVTILGDMECLALDLEAMSGNHGSIYKLLERDIVREFARVYRTTLKRRPSASKNGTFFHLMQEIALQIGDVWNTEPPIFGATLIAGVIDELTAGWNYSDELMKHA